MVLVPLRDLHDLQAGLDSLISKLDDLTRLRPELIRMRRLLGEMDPDKTPIRPHAIPEDAFRNAVDFADEHWGPRKK